MGRRGWMWTVSDRATYVDPALAHMCKIQINQSYFYRICGNRAPPLIRRSWLSLCTQWWFPTTVSAPLKGGGVFKKIFLCHLIIKLLWKLSFSMVSGMGWSRATANGASTVLFVIKVCVLLLLAWYFNPIHFNNTLEISLYNLKPYKYCYSL